MRNELNVQVFMNAQHANVKNITEAESCVHHRCSMRGHARWLQR